MEQGSAYLLRRVPRLFVAPFAALRLPPPQEVPAVDAVMIEQAIELLPTPTDGLGRLLNVAPRKFHRLTNHDLLVVQRLFDHLRAQQRDSATDGFGGDDWLVGL